MIKEGQSSLMEGMQLDVNILMSNNFFHISRTLKSEADGLAKQVVSKLKVISGWMT